MPYTYIPHKGDVNPSHEGSRNAMILALAESPWKTEAIVGRPLCGASGNKWNEWLFRAGIHREELRIENLYPFKPPTREITSIKDKELIIWMEDLHKRISEMPGLNLIVPMGNYATFALTGKGKVRASLRNYFSNLQASVTEAERKAGITSLRGSIYLYQDLNGRKIKVIPTIHPAAVLQHAKWEKRCVADWKRIEREGRDREYRVPQRRHIVDPSEGQVAQYTKFVEDNAPYLNLSTDIETWGRTLSCAGFAYTPYESLTIPTLKQEERDVFLPYVKRLCESGAAKVLCNGLYDWYWLDSYNIQLWNFLWDVQLMHHAFDPIETHALDFLASRYTLQPYWKDEAKDAEEIVKYASKPEALWVYNGLDCCVPLELLVVFKEKLESLGMMDFYFMHYQQMIEPLLRMMRHGVRVDKKRQKSWAKKLQRDMVGVRRELEDAAGENLFATERKTFLRDPTNDEWDRLLVEGEVQIDEKTNAPKGKCIDREARSALIEDGRKYMIGGKNAGKMQCWEEIDKKTFSKEKLHNFFHGKLKLPVQKKRRKNGKYSETLDEGAIRKMTAKWPGKIGNYGNLLLAYREKEKEVGYLKGAWDPDGRIRCAYKMITEAGRLASSKNPMGRGYNLQNLKR